MRESHLLPLLPTLEAAPRLLSTGSQARFFLGSKLPSRKRSRPRDKPPAGRGGGGGEKGKKGKKQKREKLDPSGQREPPRIAVGFQFPRSGDPTPQPAPAPRLALPVPARGAGGRGLESMLMSRAAGGAASPRPWQPDGGRSPGPGSPTAAPPRPAGDRAGALAHAGPRLCSPARAEPCAADDGSGGLGRRGAHRLPLVRAPPAAQPRAALRAPGDRQPPRQQVPTSPTGHRSSGLGGRGWWFHRQLGFPPKQRTTIVRLWFQVLVDATSEPVVLCIVFWRRWPGEVSRVVFWYNLLVIGICLVSARFIYWTIGELKKKKWSSRRK